jgi:hypothetical protein
MMISSFLSMQRVALLATNTQSLPLNAAYISLAELKYITKFHSWNSVMNNLKSKCSILLV